MGEKGESEREREWERKRVREKEREFEIKTVLLLTLKNNKYLPSVSLSHMAFDQTSNDQTM